MEEEEEEDTTFYWTFVVSRGACQRPEEHLTDDRYNDDSPSFNFSSLSYLSPIPQCYMHLLEAIHPSIH